MKKEELFGVLAKTLFPIITSDKDIIEVAQKNNFDDKEKELFIVWLVSATVSIMLNNNANELAQEVVESCKHDMAVVEHKFVEAGYGEDVGDALRQILEENIQEWLDIVNQQFQKAKGEMHEEASEELDEGEQSGDTKELAILKFHTYFLRDAVDHEEDVDEFAEKYSAVNGDVIRTYITFNIFYGFLNRIKKGEIKLNENDPILSCLDTLIEMCSGLLEKIANEHIDGVDAKAFNDDMLELLDDHFNEFIKKMYKRAIKASQNRE